jgi:hypothetical protein
MAKHRDKIQALLYVAQTRQVVSFSADAMVQWNATATWKTVPAWLESNTCLLCSAPFAWNFSSMFKNKALSVKRQVRCGFFCCFVWFF